MGFDEGAEYTQETVVLSSGDYLIFYTDGVPDAINEDQEAFGMERFLSVIEKYTNTSAAKLLAAVEKAIQDFIGDTAPYDDITLLIAKRL